MPLEFRVVVDRAGIKSVDHYFQEPRAQERYKKLRKQYPLDVDIFIQKRVVTEWENVTSR